MVNLGVLLAEQGDPAGARAAWKQAIDTGHPDFAPKAMRNLGVLLVEQGDVEGARAAYQRAIDSGHPEQAPAALVGLREPRATQDEAKWSAPEVHVGVIRRRPTPC
jgi:Flp pilus assembly protein TadD